MADPEKSFIEKVNIVAGAITGIAVVNENLPAILSAKDQADLAALKASEAATSAAEIKALSVEASTLLPSAPATATYDSLTGKLSIGVPKGDTGDQGLQGVAGADGANGISAYQVAINNGFAGTEAEWITSLKGSKGDQGLQGEQGLQGVAGADGANGANGISAYQVALNNGFVGTEIEWVASLKGDQGLQGVAGADGTMTFTDLTPEQVASLKGEQGLQGVAGANGISAYQVALNNGFIGTEIEWVASLKGDQGLQGVAGADGTMTFTDLTPEQVASLKGEQGLQGVAGANGISAYQVALNNGFIGTEVEWLASLQGGQGIVTTTTIGTIGALGFGVGIAPAAYATSLGVSPMAGYNDVNSENYGNYIDATGSIMAFVPLCYWKFENDPLSPYYGTRWYVSDVPAAGYCIDRSFINNGNVQPGFFFDKYLCGNVNGKFCSMRNIDPVSTGATKNPIASITGVTLGNRNDAIFQAVKSRGANYAVPTMFMYTLLAKISQAHAQTATTATAAWMDVAPYAPKGCNNDALKDSNDPTVVYVTAGNATYPTAPLNASVKDEILGKITHNGQKCGIADINGNMWEIASGFIQSTADTFLVLKESKDIKTLTGVVVTDATDNWNTANYDAITLPFTPDETQTTFGNGTSAVFSGNTDTASNAYRLDAAGIPLSMGGAPARFGGDALYKYSTASMCPVVGGGWGYASLAGVWARHWVAARSTTNVDAGGRACLMGA